MKRADYQTVLHEAALAAGCEIRLGAKVVAVDEDSPAVTLETGERIDGDLVVVADGELATLDPCRAPTDIVA